MKVITVQQPFASLIAAGIKEYEFRSWKTACRGEMLIHAGKSVNKHAMEKYAADGLTFPTGVILARVTLADCIPVDDAFRELLREKNLRVYGHIIRSTDWKGYAFRLENVRKVEPIPVNGRLGLWEYDGEIRKL